MSVCPSLALAQPADAPDAQPEAAPKKLRVGISPFAPFVIEGDAADGYSIDLWKEVATRIGRPFEFVKCTGAADKLERLMKDELDVAIGGLTTTPERESKIDFTHPTYRSGLGIMLPGQAEKSGLWESLTGALARTNSTVIFAFFVIVFVAGNLIWFIERDEDTFDKRYVAGMFEGVYWAIVTASTVGYGDKAPVKYAGRVVAMLVIIISLPMFALFTAELASAFTLQSIEAAIRSPEDLQGRPVGVVRGTSSANFAADRGLQILQWPTIAEVYTALEEGKVQAVIYDAPSLTYYSQTQGAGKVHMVDRVFDVRDLAMATQQGSTLREQINRALLDMEAEGKLVDLRVRWFGSN